MNEHEQQVLKYMREAFDLLVEASMVLQAHLADSGDFKLDDFVDLVGDLHIQCKKFEDSLNL